jgi:hypothetical protein
MEGKAPTGSLENLSERIGLVEENERQIQAVLKDLTERLGRLEAFVDASM